MGRDVCASVSTAKRRDALGVLGAGRVDFLVLLVEKQKGGFGGSGFGFGIAGVEVGLQRV